MTAYFGLPRGVGVFNTLVEIAVDKSAETKVTLASISTCTVCTRMSACPSGEFLLREIPQKPVL
jgi:hypothetical protein